MSESVSRLSRCDLLFPTLVFDDLGRFSEMIAGKFGVANGRLQGEDSVETKQSEVLDVRLTARK